MARTNYAFCFGDGQIGQNNMVLDVDVTRNAFQRGMYFGLQQLPTVRRTPLCLVRLRLSKLVRSIANRTLESSNEMPRYRVAQFTPLHTRPTTEALTLTNAGNWLVEHLPGSQPNWGNIGERPWDCLMPFTGFATINAPNQGSCTRQRTTDGVKATESTR